MNHFVSKKYTWLIAAVSFSLPLPVAAQPAAKQASEINNIATGSNLLYAQPETQKSKKSEPKRPKKPESAKGQAKAKHKYPSATEIDWQQKRIRPEKVDRAPKYPEKGLDEMQFPPPAELTSNAVSSFYGGLALLGEALKSMILPKAAHAIEDPAVVVDGDLSEWAIKDRLNIPANLPPYLAEGNAIYGKFVGGSEPAYVVAVRSTGAPIASNTTLWLNTDQNALTGYRIWGSYGGAEYFVNVYSDLSVHLYNAQFGWVSSLQYAYSSDGQSLEVSIPLDRLEGVAPYSSLDLLGDINDNVFLFPEDYWSGAQYTILGQPFDYPPRTDFTRKVGIVYSETNRSNFYSDKAYSQLFMALQNQAMMAGVAFEFIEESELRDLKNLVNLDALLFTYFAHVPDDSRDEIYDNLYKAVYHYGIGIVAADNWLTNNGNGESIPGDAYRFMKQLLGIGRVDGVGPVDIQVHAGDVEHFVMQGYMAGQNIVNYSPNWFSYFEPVPGQAVAELATQTIYGEMAGVYPAVLATETGGRNVHFSNLGFLGDTNLVWKSLQWVIFGAENTAGLKLTRNESLLISRNDMDQAQEIDEVQTVHVPLLSMLEAWKDDFNFVGSFYIDIGNAPRSGQWTDWNVSGPLFQSYIQLGNEIGTHSYTHPHETDLLSSDAIEFEFNQSMNLIQTHLGETWRGNAIRGGAVPGMPESFDTSNEIIAHLDYLSGGYAGKGAGYPNAFGYITPQSEKVYLSPNMSFDFTMIEFGVPMGYPPVPTPLSSLEAEQFWKDEMLTLSDNASSPIIHWPWHDYGPTMSDPDNGHLYSRQMFENFIAYAFNMGSEFVTAADATQRIKAFKESSLVVDAEAGQVIAAVDTLDGGKFSLEIRTVENKIIDSVENWYAYSDSKVFLDRDGGTYRVSLSSNNNPFPPTHITALPMRADLIELVGNGSNLDFKFIGEGWVFVTLSGSPADFLVEGADAVQLISGNDIAIFFDSYATHNVSVTRVE
jgi:hypothetical protein